MNLSEAFTDKLGPPVEDPEEETFILYSRPRTSHSLGFVDSKASSVDVTIHDKDYTIHQSPSILSSSRAGGTTGAVLWNITPLFASWLSSPQATTLLPQLANILELGCGISPLNALALAHPHHPTGPLLRYTLTDQPYVSKLIAQNLEENAHHLQPAKRSKNRGKGAARAPEPASIVFRELDWETDAVEGVADGAGGFDLVLAVDCVYNEALIGPLVQTCADACRLRGAACSDEGQGEGGAPSVCIVAQQLRDDTVFEAWLKAFHREFVAWRVPDEVLPDGLRPKDGFVIFAGVLREGTASS